MGDTENLLIKELDEDIPQEDIEPSFRSSSVLMAGFQSRLEEHVQRHRKTASVASVARK